jgi:phosphate uptake regulator
MKRKVIQIAESTQLISLPRKWAQLHNIKKGDELEISEEGSILKINADKDMQFEKATLHLSTPENFMKRSISTLYKQGYDEIDITFDDAAVVDLIQAEVGELLGLEIVNQTEKSCVLKNIAQGLDTEFDNILRRIFLITISMAKDSYEAIEKGDLERLDDIAKIEKTNNKLVIFCERLLNKKGYKDYKKVCFLYNLVNNLERLADEYRDICDYMYSNKKAKVGKDTMQIYKGCNDLFEFFYKIFYNYSLDDVVGYRKKRIEIESKAYSLLKTKESTDIIFLHYLLIIVKLLHHVSIELSG